MEGGQYLAYCMFNSFGDFGTGEIQAGERTVKSKFVKSAPLEVFWMKYDKETYRGKWSDLDLVENRKGSSFTQLPYTDGFGPT